MNNPGKKWIENIYPSIFSFYYHSLAKIYVLLFSWIRPNWYVKGRFQSSPDEYRGIGPLSEYIALERTVILLQSVKLKDSKYDIDYSDRSKSPVQNRFYCLRQLSGGPSPAPGYCQFFQYQLNNGLRMEQSGPCEKSIRRSLLAQKLGRKFSETKRICIPVKQLQWYPTRVVVGDTSIWPTGNIYPFSG